MLVVIGLVAYAVLVAVLTPSALGRGHWQIRRPLPALVLWQAACLSALCALVAAIVLSTARVVGTTREAGGWPSGRVAMLTTLLAWVGLGIVAGIVALMKQQSEPILCSARDLGAEVRALVDVAGYRSELREGVTVHFVESSRVFACASPGRDPVIVVSSALADALDAPQVEAVVEHEYAHLRERHNVALRLAELNAAWWPRLAGAEALSRATTLMVELVADDRAADRCGTENLADALLRIGELEGDEGMLLRAHRLLART